MKETSAFNWVKSKHFPQNEGLPGLVSSPINLPNVIKSVVEANISEAKSTLPTQSVDEHKAEICFEYRQNPCCAIVDTKSSRSSE